MESSNGTNLFPINSSADERGKVTFVNDFDMSDVKRSLCSYKYIIKNCKGMAWSQNEKKWVTVQKGEFLVCVVKVDSFDNPEKNAEVKEYY